MEEIMHIILKYNDSVYNIDTIEEHKKVINEKGKVVWGIIKPKVDSPGISDKKIKEIKSQIERKVSTFAFMCTGGNIKARGHIIDIINSDEVQNVKEFLPEYYKKDLNKCIAGVLLGEIKDEDNNIINDMQRYQSIDGSVALGNQTNPLYVSFKEKVINEQTGNINEKIEEEKLEEEVISKFDSVPEVIDYIHKYIYQSGFIYDYQDLANFFLCLKTKPFVILAGISGTGKSRLVRLFANAVGSDVKNGRLNIIPVKPDWNDNTELLGYKNINNEFVPGKLTEIILRATDDPNRMYFVCLDEMNLARVEYYLSDYLSIIESRNFKNYRIITDKIFDDEYLKDNPKYKNLYIPENLYLVGTVNMDDTTYAFSRKVLDRANTIEFSNVELENLNFSDEEIDEKVLPNNLLKTRFLTIKDAINFDKEYVEKINKKVIEINNILMKGNKHFGYRVRDEIIFYMLENKISGVIENEDIGFDYVIMQKILPTITGSEAKLKEILIGIYNNCNPTKQIAATSNYIAEAEKFLDNARYKKSASKIIEMLRGYEDGFTSYWV